MMSKENVKYFTFAKKLFLSHAEYLNHLYLNLMTDKYCTISTEYVLLGMPVKILCNMMIRVPNINIIVLCAE